MTKFQLLQKALEYYGERETHGGLTNKKILYFLNNTSGLEIKENTPWCAAFVGSLLKDNGFKSSKSLTARAYAKVGKATRTPKLGDIAVLWRGNPEGWQGHVGFFIREVDNVIYILGGNQNNKVCIKAYSIKQLICYRSPVSK